jgi:phenylpyruvate tautomerase PptA (4-oxalocrotonate tautomerase family)
MPMLDIHIPAGALSDEIEDGLVDRLTDLLLIYEGARPQSRARSLAWVWVHRPAAVYVGGERARRPRYKLVPSVPEGQYTDERRRAVVATATEAVLDAEEAMGRTRDADVVWVFPTEVPEGTWGLRGVIMRLADIAGLVLGSATKGGEYARSVLAARR